MYAKFLCRVCCSVDTSRCKLLFLRSNLTKEMFFLTEEEEKYSRSSSGRAENYSVSSDSSAFALNVNLLDSLDTSGAFFLAGGCPFLVWPLGGSRMPPNEGGSVTNLDPAYVAELLPGWCLRFSLVTHSS